jgi:hypothetical protein
MFNNKGSFVWRLIGVLLLIGLIIGGGVMAYRFGYAEGLADAPEIATVISKAAEDGQPLPVPPMIRYGRSYANPLMWMHPRHGFIPFGGVVGFFLLALLFVGLMRLIFRPWGWHYGHMYGRGPWKDYGRHWGPPPWEHEGKEGEAETDSEKEDK